jgi:hypothetical protein
VFILITYGSGTPGWKKKKLLLNMGTNTVFTKEGANAVSLFFLKAAKSPISLKSMTLSVSKFRERSGLSYSTLMA